MPKSTSEVAEIVHQNLDGIEIDDRSVDAKPLSLVVENDSIRQTDYSWRIRVRPSREPRRWTYVYEELALAAIKIADETGLNVVFTADDPLTTEFSAI